MSFSGARAEAFGRSSVQQRFVALTAWQRHQQLVSDYQKFYARPGEGSGQPQRTVKTDFDGLQEAHRFIRTDADDAENTWEVRLAKRYYDRLFREYAIADLSRHREQRIGLRWRTEREVVTGKGQFVCGAKGCDSKDDLCSYEVNFAYQEAGEQKQALVKLRVCPACAARLNHGRKNQYQKAPQRGKRSRSQGPEGGDDDDEADPRAAARKAKAARLAEAEALLRRLQDQSEAEAAEGRSSVAAPPGRAQQGSAQQQQQQQVDGGVGVPGAAAQAPVLPADDSVWEQRPVQEASAEEEFDAYFAGLFD